MINESDVMLEIHNCHVSQRSRIVSRSASQESSGRSHPPKAIFSFRDHYVRNSVRLLWSISTNCGLANLPQWSCEMFNSPWWGHSPSSLFPLPLSVPEHPLSESRSTLLCQYKLLNWKRKNKNGEKNIRLFSQTTERRTNEKTEHREAKRQRNSHQKTNEMKRNEIARCYNKNTS